MRTLRVLAVMGLVILATVVSPAAYAEGALGRVTADPCLSVRDTLDSSSSDPVCIPKNTVVSLNCATGQWVQLSSGEHTGYAMAAGVDLGRNAAPLEHCSDLDGRDGLPGTTQIDFPALVLDPPRPRQPDRREPVETLTSFRAALAGCSLAGWRLCSDLGQHYLSGAGTDYRIVFDDLVSSEPFLQDRYSELLHEAMASSLAQVDAASSGESLTFGSDWRMVRSAKNGDARFALGTFSIRVGGEVVFGLEGTDGERGVEVRYRLFLADVYDFAACRGGDPFCVYRSLADLGHAAEFLVYGAGDTVELQSTVADLRRTPLELDW